MKIDQYCQRQRVSTLNRINFWNAFASHGFVSDSWASCSDLLLPSALAAYSILVYVAYVFQLALYESTLKVVIYGALC